MTPDRRCCTAEMAVKVYYEVRMFEFLFKRLECLADECPEFRPGKMIEVGTSPLAADERREAFAQLESFLLHARVLRDFFFRSPKFSDDVVAKYFVPDWETHRPPQGPYFVGDREGRLNKALAHLTTKRLDHDADQKKWDVTAIHRELQPVITLFLEKLPDERKPWFTDPMDQDD